MLQVFSDYVCNALHELGENFPIPNFHNTAAFIKLIATWRDIVNVTTSTKGIRLNNKYQKPLTTADTESNLFLHQFLDWVSDGEKMSQTSGKLTRKIHTALVRTTKSIGK